MAKKFIIESETIENENVIPTQNEPKILKFKVHSFRRLSSPYKTNENVGPSICFAVCDVKSLPDDIPMETNPREQNLNTNVAKKIKKTLVEGNSDFYLLNRGILISAESVSFNNYSSELTVVFSDLSIHGNVDGGHTYRIIRENRDQLEPGQQYVTLEILTGVEDIFQSLAAARNTSVQVQDKSIAELENRFQIIKDALKDQSYIGKIFFKENDDNGDIDVADVLSILMMFNISRFSDRENCPTIAYSAKKRCIDLYIQDHQNYEKSGSMEKNPYVKMSKIMPDIFKLYDEIEINMKKFYQKKNPGGKYGLTKGVISPRENQKFTSKFLGRSLELQSPNGFIYPILGAFRALVKEGDDGYYYWSKNPFQILNKVGPELVESTVSMSRSLGNNPQSTGKNSNLWKTLYMTVAFETMS